MTLRHRAFESTKELKNDQTTDKIMQRIRAKLRRDSSITEPSAYEAAMTGHMAPSPAEQIDFGAINARIETAQKRSLVCKTSPGMNRFPAIIRPFARSLGKVVLFFAQVVTKRQEAYNIGAIQAMDALAAGMRSLAERQATLQKELVALNRRVLENTIPSMDDALYVAFENKFRGTREEIKKRARIYLPAVARALSTSGGGTILDLGCGRGEWLELLREQNISASGVDCNRAMVEECRSRGLPVEQADVMEHLNDQPGDAFAAVTGFHLIEHLPLSIWIRLLDETLRILKRGGVAIFETPNPENVLVGSNTFYFDPTHRNPLPSALVQFIASELGFDPVEIIKLRPLDAENLLTEGTPVSNKFNYYFYGPRDYAIVGWKKNSETGG